MSRPIKEINKIRRQLDLALDREKAETLQMQLDSCINDIALEIARMKEIRAKVDAPHYCTVLLDLHMCRYWDILSRMDDMNKKFHKDKKSLKRLHKESK